MSGMVEVKKAGRPATADPKKGVGGKGRLLSANISQEIRDALEREAERTGRSISQTAELWLDDARKGRAAVETIVGSFELVGVVAKLGQIAHSIKALPLDALEKRSALEAAWIATIPQILPWQPNSRVQEYLSLENDFRAAITRVLSAIRDAPRTDPVAVRASEGMETRPDGLLGQRTIRTGPSIEAILYSYSHNSSWAQAGPALTELRAAGSTASAEIENALAIGKRLSEMLDELDQSRRRGAEAGRAAAESYAPPQLSPQVAR